MKFYRVLYQFILSRRYRVSFKGLSLLSQPGAKLIFPNHQSHIDPQLIAVECYKYSDIVPVVNEKYFKIPVVRFFLKKFNAVAVSDFKGGNRDPHILKKIFSGVIKALEEGKTVIIYPSGQVQETALERIKNKQSAYTIVKQLPDGTKVLGLRITGLWGSSFSSAWTGAKPIFLKRFLIGIGYFFANLIFFSPKRNVEFEFTDITQDVIREAQGDRQSFNQFLETFFNHKGEEKAYFVRHFFFLPGRKNKV